MSPLNREFHPHIHSLTGDEVVHPRFAIGLQGGGSWGAWTAGVLKTLIPVLCAHGTIVSVSGTSAGALNGAALVSGMNDGGPYEALRRVDRLWNTVKNYGRLFGFNNTLSHIFSMATGNNQWPNIPQLFLKAGQPWSAFFPYHLTGGSPTTRLLSQTLKDVIPSLSSLQNGPTKLHTNTVRTNLFTLLSEHVIHSGKDLTWDSVVCSAALKEFGPHVIRDYQDPLAQFNEFANIYHDGAYEANPALTPLLESGATDIIIISLHSHEPETTLSAEKKKRDNLYCGEIHLDLTTLSLDDGARYNFHLIDMSAPAEWGASSRLNTSPEFIDLLQQQGAEFAEDWIRNNSEYFGICSTHRPRAQVLKTLSAQHGINY